MGKMFHILPILLRPKNRQY